MRRAMIGEKLCLSLKRIIIHMHLPPAHVHVVDLIVCALCGSCGEILDDAHPSRPPIRCCKERETFNRADVPELLSEELLGSLERNILEQDRLIGIHVRMVLIPTLAAFPPADRATGPIALALRAAGSVPPQEEAPALDGDAVVDGLLGGAGRLVDAHAHAPRGPIAALEHPKRPDLPENREVLLHGSRWHLEGRAGEEDAGRLLIVPIAPFR
mmetsp:Transcript_8905/g.23686  ORF Transcript_8905/g.23686 Transcript_8905/m.23686 type:complete len:213 (-) Transcript_8905:97-735(-)